MLVRFLPFNKRDLSTLLSILYSFISLDLNRIYSEIKLTFSSISISSFSRNLTELGLMSKDLFILLPFVKKYVYI